ncbi:MmpS family transport accessory protein [Pseudonocardia spirodelae]|uniref:MmpS family transport accessory protein n=1 Tax=Pseudonocardia spirodelae TaxID=3133431 RepID=A0ABU8T0W5_9PSEU
MGDDDRSGIEARWAAMRADARATAPGGARTADPAALADPAAPGHPQPSRVRRWARAAVALTAVAAAAFAAGWVTGIGGVEVLTSSVAAHRDVAAPPATRPAVPVGGPAPTPAPTTAPTTAPASDPAPAGGYHPAHYVYEVTANHPVALSYLDAQGEHTEVASTVAPWRLEVPTGRWGRDAEPQLIVRSTSGRGDAQVSCRVTDPTGRVVATDDTAEADAIAWCWVF